MGIKGGNFLVFLNGSLVIFFFGKFFKFGSLVNGLELGWLLKGLFFCFFGVGRFGILLKGIFLNGLLFWVLDDCELFWFLKFVVFRFGILFVGFLGLFWDVWNGLFFGVLLNGEFWFVLNGMLFGRLKGLVFCEFWDGWLLVVRFVKGLEVWFLLFVLFFGGGFVFCMVWKRFWRFVFGDVWVVFEFVVFLKRDVKLIDGVFVFEFWLNNEDKLMFFFWVVVFLLFGLEVNVELFGNVKLGKRFKKKKKKEIKNS